MDLSQTTDEHEDVAHDLSDAQKTVGADACSPAAHYPATSLSHHLSLWRRVHDRAADHRTFMLCDECGPYLS
jgi:hypothetical protein